MASYGFRLFEVELRERNGRKAVEMSTTSGEHLAALVERLLRDRLKDKKVGYPSRVADEDGNPADEPHQNKPALLVQDVQRVGTTVLWRAQYGRYSDFNLGLGLPGSPDSDLTDVAPSRGYRAILNLPPKGTKGVLVVEDISRSCPVQMLVRWLKQASQEDAADQATAVVAKTGLTGEPLTAAVADAMWWRLSVKPMADEEHLQKLVREGKLERIELIKRAYGRANTPQSRAMELKYFDLSPARARGAGNLVNAWWKANRSEVDDPKTQRVTDAEGAKALAVLLGKEIAALDFDDGFVVVEEAGKKKQISPSRLADYFIYPITRDRQPSKQGFYEAAAAKHKRIARATGTDAVTWPSIL